MESKRERLQARLAELKAERSNWEPVWKDLGEQFAFPVITDPRSQRNRGEKRDSKILNSKPLRAARTLEAGMMAGITSPARDWYRLATFDERLEDVKPVRQWLDDCHAILSSALQRSNFYDALAGGLYPGMVRSGTGAMFHEELPGGEMTFRPLQVGEFWLDVNDKGRVDTCFREIAMTVRQIVAKFGLANVSPGVREAYSNNKLGMAFVVTHAVYPNSDYAEGAVGPDGMRWSSCWYDANDPDKAKFLHEGGYNEFPVHAPRWGAANSDAYGRGPGWECRGDCRMLQHHERRLMAMVDKIVDPPMRASGQIARTSLLPGDVTFVPSGQGGSFEPAVIIPPAAVEVMRERIAEVEDRISQTMFEHLWNLLIADERNQRPTATEVEAKRQEVMLMLGPLLESLNNELLKPVIERAFAILDRNGLFPEPPDELDGQEVKIEFISIMHQMQQATGLVSVRTLVDEVAAIAQMRPDVLDKVEFDVVVDELARITGIRPDAILSQEEVERVRKVRAQQAMQQQQDQAALAATQGLKNLSGVNPTQLSDLAGALSPVAAAQGGALSGVGAAA